MSDDGSMRAMLLLSALLSIMLYSHFLPQIHSGPLSDLCEIIYILARFLVCFGYGKWAD